MSNNEFLQCIASMQMNLYVQGQQACVAVFRALTMPTQTLVTRMLYLESCSMDLLQVQCHNSEQYLKEAQKVGILRVQQTLVELDPSFGRALRTVIEGESQPILREIGKSKPDPSICQAQWKSLFNLISQADHALSYRQRIQETFRKSELLNKNSGVGFQFILTSTQRQINQILTYYVRASVNKPETIRILLGLSLLDPEIDYEMPKNELERDIILDLQQLGLTSVDRVVKITHLLWNFLYEEPTVSIDIRCNIIVEANFRIYAYLETKDKVEESILYNLLSLFAEIKKQFPNLIIADLSDLSVKKACRRNLKAQQIIQFLEMNNKQQVIQKTKTVSEEYKKRLSFLRVFQSDPEQRTIIPHNVVQQLRFWEEEIK